MSISACTEHVVGSVPVCSIYAIPASFDGCGNTDIIFAKSFDAVAVGADSIHSLTSLFQRWYVDGVNIGQGSTIVDAVRFCAVFSPYIVSFSAPSEGRTFHHWRQIGRTYLSFWRRRPLGDSWMAAWVGTEAVVV